MTDSSYTWFLYLGIFIFVLNTLLNKPGDISLFGLLLIYVGYFKQPIYNWIYYMFWIFIGLEIISISNAIRGKMKNPKDTKKSTKKRKKVSFEEKEKEPTTSTSTPKK